MMEEELWQRRGWACLEASQELTRPRHCGFYETVTMKGQEEGAHTQSQAGVDLGGKVPASYM